MNIALIGYGRMNQAIEKAALERGHTITARVNNNDDFHDAILKRAQDEIEIDIAMEFSIREAAPDNMRALIENHIPTIAGTTGCDCIEEMRSLADKENVGFLWASNYSIGVNIFWQVVAEATKRFDKFAEYDVFGHEAHHNKKADSPSGTALTTAERILESSSRKKTLVVDKLDRMPKESELHFSSVRGGSIPGHHSVTFDSPTNTVEIRQTARASAEFATGAVLAAEWLADKKGNKTMNDFLSEYQPS